MVLLAACGGGGGDATSAANPAGTGSPKATLVTPSTGKTAWRRATPASITLADASGATVTAPLSCTADDPSVLRVAADCSSITGLRLGTPAITVRSGTVTARFNVKVIPPTQPLASHDARGITGAMGMLVTPEGRVLAWGSNDDGLLGQGRDPGELQSSALPLAVKSPSGTESLSGIVAASASWRLALALTEDGEVYSWGQSRESLGRTVAGALATLPGKVVGADGTGTLQRIVAVSAGSSFNVVALRDDGTVFAWGNATGQPDGTTTAIPRAVAEATDAVAVSAGSAWSMALQSDGRIVSWGWTASRGAGRPGATGSSAPSFVMAQASGQPLTGIAAIEAGPWGGFAITSGGEVRTWGDTLAGIVNTTGSSVARPAAIPALGTDGITPLSGVARIAFGNLHAVALTTSGQVLTWGVSNRGQLGEGGSLPSNVALYPVAARAPSGAEPLQGVVAVAAGWDQSLALTNDGRVLIWGEGVRGGLAQGSASTLPYSRLPVAIKNESGTADLTFGSGWAAGF